MASYARHNMLLSVLAFEDLFSSIPFGSKPLVPRLLAWPIRLSLRFDRGGSHHRFRDDAWSFGRRRSSLRFG